MLEIIIRIGEVDILGMQVNNLLGLRDFVQRNPYSAGM